jgi:hypothetical protein
MRDEIEEEGARLRRKAEHKTKEKLSVIVAIGLADLFGCLQKRAEHVSDHKQKIRLPGKIVCCVGFVTSLGESLGLSRELKLRAGDSRNSSRLAVLPFPAPLP